VALTPGTRLGIYQITAPLGEGGMGQVWRARDTKLDRDVAIKVLPEAFAHDADRLARFTREAKTLAALNHPNIAHIHGLEESGGTTALVMELVEGEDLSQRIARLRAPGASARQAGMPLDEALPIAKQIAEALEAAHEQGIIHRDLKPANIKVRADGTVKVLDFGLAKALDTLASSATADAMNSPTITSPAMTQAGMILGTAAYMAPEQARGKTVDRRADIWAFGAVLFEMLTGTRAFRGEDVTDTIVSVISKEPDWSLVPGTTPAGLRRLLTRCLKKDVKTRLQAIGDARVQLDDLLSGAPEDGGSATSTTQAAAASARGRRPLLAALAVAAALAAALAVPALRHLREAPPPVPPETRLHVVTPATSDLRSFALSPDGRQIVFAADGGGVAGLWLRPLSSTTARALAGTEGANLPFWSPDGQSIGFFADNALKRLDLAGGVPQTLASVSAGYGGTWNADGVILFAPNSAVTPLFRVSATGGTAVPVPQRGLPSDGHSTPQFLPDGRFLFFVRGGSDVQGIYLGALDGGAPKRLVAADAGGAYLPAHAPAAGASAIGEGGWLLWLRPGTATLVAQPLDLATATLVGEPVTLADGVATDSRLNMPAISVAPGLVAYRSGDGNARQLTWVDRSGIPRGVVGPRDSTLSNPSVSPEGQRVAVARVTQRYANIWLFDGLREGRLTSEPRADRFPVWSADGARVVFSRVEAAINLYQKRRNGSGEAEPVLASDESKVATSASKDGRFLFYNSVSNETNVDIWVAPLPLRPSTGSGRPDLVEGREPQGHPEPGRGMTGDRTPAVWLKTPFREGYAMFSPDGRWVAYQSNESGRPEIYVRPFVPPADRASAAETDGQWQVSTNGGIHPVWRHDGKELFYLSPAGEMMAAPITATAGGVAPGAPVALFQTRVVGGGIDALQARQYDVAPDGRFLINTTLEDGGAPITIIQHWNPEVKK